MNILALGVGIDLSSGGMGLTTQQPLKRGQILKLFFPVTEDQTKLPVLIEVMWTSFVAGEFRTGVRFLM